MKNIRVARRYAAALMALTGEHKKPDTVAKELLLVKETLRKSREFRLLLASPIVAKAKKKSVIEAVFKKKASAVVRTYLCSIVNKGREDMLVDILEQYFLLRDEQLGIVAVDISTAVKFSPLQEKKLTKYLESYTQKKVRVRFSIDTSVKGGFVATIGDTTLDASIRRQVEILRHRLKEGGFTAN
ncbi:MAG: ATP synthase F1 subunit delta [bacterium]